jgi:hypothetical protein
VKKTKDTLEMLGEFLRDAAVLVCVFFPLEMSDKGRSIPFPVLMAIAGLSLGLLLGGIYFEKLRR